MIRLLRHTARERGGPIARWLVRHGVVHLETLPHTPQHNAACEHGHGELEGDAELSLRRCRAAIRVARQRLLDSATQLDGHRLRASRGWQTAVEADVAALPWTVHVSRRRFCATAHWRIHQAVLHSTKARARRRATRQAVLHALEDFKLITITRGGNPPPSCEKHTHRGPPGRWSYDRVRRGCARVSCQLLPVGRPVITSNNEVAGT